MAMGDSSLGVTACYQDFHVICDSNKHIIITLLEHPMSIFKNGGNSAHKLLKQISVASETESTFF